jgi:hypothetical protein
MSWTIDVYFREQKRHEKEMETIKKSHTQHPGDPSGRFIPTIKCELCEAPYRAEAEAQKQFWDSFSLQEA